jgi:AraC-like DNA-binding protein
MGIDDERGVSRVAFGERAWRSDAATSREDLAADPPMAPRHPSTFRYRRAPQGLPAETVTARGAPTGWVELHETFTVCVVESSVPVWYRVGSRRYERSPEVGMLLGPGELHADRMRPGTADYRVLRFDLAAVHAAARGLGAEPEGLSVVEHELRSPIANELFLSLHRALEAGVNPSDTSVLMDRCLSEILRHCATAPGKSNGRKEICAARDYILAHLSDRTSLEALSAAAGMRKWAFIGAFRRHVGVPPLRYAIQVRLARARTLLASGRPCNDVAADLGFFDQSHLNRWFRRTYGVAPGEYQRALLDPKRDRNERR